MSILNSQYPSAGSSSWSQPGNLRPFADKGSILTSEPSTTLSSAMHDTGLASLSQDASAWHQKMGKAYGYDPASPSPEKAASEAFRQNLAKALQTGDFSQLGLPIEAVPGEQMGGRPAAFLGGDTATSADDRIVVNQDLLQKANHDPAARAQLNAGIVEEFMHGLERKIHQGKSGDMQLNASGEIAFMQEGQGRSFDEGKFARELARQPYHNFEDLKIKSAVEDHGVVYLDGVAHQAEFKDYNPDGHPIDEIANDNKNHSARYRTNRKDNAYINEAFDGPEAFEKIWNHHENDQDLGGWLGKRDMKGSRATTRGVTEFVGWVLEQADPVKAPKAQAEKEKLLGEDGILGDNKWLNSRNNDEIDGSGADTTQEISANLLKHVPATRLVQLEGTRAGTSNVQKAIGEQIANDPQAFKDLHTYFGQGSNGADFLNKFTDDEIRTMDPNLLLAIPLEQIKAAKGTRGDAALEKIFSMRDGTGGTFKNGGKWENQEGFIPNKASFAVQQELYGEKLSAFNNEKITPGHSGSEVARSLFLALDDKSEIPLSPKFLEDFFTNSLGHAPSGDKANSPRERETFQQMNAIDSYAEWEQRASNAPSQGNGGNAAIFRSSELGKDFARWSLRTDTGDGNGADETTNKAMGELLSNRLLGGDGTDLTNMSHADQQWYLDNWILPNQGLEENLLTSLSIPAKAVADAKAANGGKLPADAGPLVQFLDGINTLSADVTDELEAGNPGRSLKGTIEAGTSGSSTAVGKAFTNSLRNRFGSTAANTTARTVATGASSSSAETAAGAAGAEAAASASAAGAAAAGAIFAGATAAMIAGHNALAAGRQEGGGGEVFDPNRMRGGMDETQGADEVDAVSGPELITQWGSYDLVDIYNKTHHAGFKPANATDEEIKKYKQWMKFVTGGKEEPTSNTGNLELSDGDNFIQADLNVHGTLEYNIAFDKNFGGDFQHIWPGVRGADLFTRMMLHYGDNVQQIKGLWLDNSNYTSYWKAVKDGYDPVDKAPFQTFAGKMAERFGFTQVENLNPDPSTYNVEDVNLPDSDDSDWSDEEVNIPDAVELSFVKP